MHLGYYIDWFAIAANRNPANTCSQCHPFQVYLYLPYVACTAQAGPEINKEDVRPLHWVEQAKSGDCWVLCKEGGLEACHGSMNGGALAA